MSDSKAQLLKYHYRRRLPHWQKADTDFFITFCTGGRQELPAEARDLVLQHACVKAECSVWRERAPAPHHQEFVYMRR